jgi:hypothetical protein
MDASSDVRNACGTPEHEIHGGDHWPHRAFVPVDPLQQHEKSFAHCCPRSCLTVVRLIMDHAAASMSSNPTMLTS